MNKIDTRKIRPDYVITTMTPNGTLMKHIVTAVDEKYTYAEGNKYSHYFVYNRKQPFDAIISFTPP